MARSRFPLLRLLGKAIANVAAFIAALLFLVNTNLPKEFDDYVFRDNFVLKAWVHLVIYRACIYFVYPIAISVIEFIFPKRRAVPFRYRLLENFNVEFFAYTVVTAVYALLGGDKYFGVEIFGSADSFMFIGSFIFTLIIDKSIPLLFYDPKVDNAKYDRKIPNSVDLASIEFYVDPFSKSRDFLKYDYIGEEKGETLYVVLKNPSKSFADGSEPSKQENCIDITTYNVMKCVSEYNKVNAKKYTRVIILNLFPEFSTEPEFINKIYKFKKMKAQKPNTYAYKRMHKWIGKNVGSNGDVLFAWGGNNGIYAGSYQKAIDEMTKHFNGFSKFEYDKGTIVPYKGGIPTHARVWDKITTGSDQDEQGPEESQEQ